MVFSSSVFMFFFLTGVLLVYFVFLRKRSHRNIFLTLASLFFYGWGEPSFMFVMLFSIAVNWICGRLIADNMGSKKKRFLVLAVVLDIGLLSVYKYLMFIMENLNWAFGLHMPIPSIALPIGISFFTFQAMSYVIDVYRGDGVAQKKFMNVCLYIAFFPQLIAGPIVRYQTVADEINDRKETLTDFAKGSRRFMQGLAKKALLANNLGLLVDSALKIPTNELSVVGAWIVAACYVFQAYYDFSGYSDMAIGLGLMFGFHFLENFNFPMLGRSMSGFWRRWHLSLGTWFRDYVFIPLGGSRGKPLRVLLNMLIVWFLTGLWHGADWNFVVWGLITFFFLAIERFTGLGKWMDKHPVGHVYTIVVIFSISIFLRMGMIDSATMMTTGTVMDSFKFIGAMYGATSAGFFDEVAGMYLREYGVFILFAILCSVPLMSMIENRFKLKESFTAPVRAVSLAAVFVLALSYIIMGGYNPFIYFNF